MDYLFLALGLGLLLLAADLLVDSSVAIAQRARISNFIIGLTIVGIIFLLCYVGYTAYLLSR